MATHVIFISQYDSNEDRLENRGLWCHECEHSGLILLSGVPFTKNWNPAKFSHKVYYLQKNNTLLNIYATHVLSISQYDSMKRYRRLVGWDDIIVNILGRFSYLVYHLQKLKTLLNIYVHTCSFISEHDSNKGRQETSGLGCNELEHSLSILLSGILFYKRLNPY